MVAIFLIASVTVFAQENKTFTIDSLYQNKSEMILYSKVIEFPGKSKTEILNGVKNWASVNFVNLKEVLVSESQDQIVLNYLTKSFYTKTLGMTNVCDWYIRLIIEFKDGKSRVTFIDDGNAFWPGSQYGPATSPRIYKLSMYFRDGEEQPRKVYYGGLVSLKNNVVTIASSIKLDEIKKNQDNW